MAEYNILGSVYKEGDIIKEYSVGIQNYIDYINNTNRSNNIIFDDLYNQFSNNGYTGTKTDLEVTKPVIPIIMNTYNLELYYNFDFAIINLKDLYDNVLNILRVDDTTIYNKIIEPVFNGNYDSFLDALHYISHDIKNDKTSFYFHLYSYSYGEEIGLTTGFLFYEQTKGLINLTSNSIDYYEYLSDMFNRKDWLFGIDIENGNISPKMKLYYEYCTFNSEEINKLQDLTGLNAEDIKPNIANLKNKINFISLDIKDDSLARGKYYYY